MTDNKHKIFVYGTLKRGHPNHCYLPHSAKFLGQAKVLGTMLDIGPCPAYCRHMAKKTDILGEVYEVDDSTLEDLDCLEANGYLYDRLPTKTYFTSKGHDIDLSGQVMNTWVYTWLQSTEYPIVQSGDWKGRQYQYQ